jgi:hypothetical protein
MVQKYQRLEILKEKVARQRIHFFNHLIKTLCSMGSKCLVLSVGHRCRIILTKNMFGCPLKFILEFLGIFCISAYKLEYSYIIIYECENTPFSNQFG